MFARFYLRVNTHGLDVDYRGIRIHRLVLV
jgi:hypothetical protein